MVTYPISWPERQFGSVIDTIEAGVSVRSCDSSATLPAVLKTSALSKGRFDCTQRKSIVAEDLSRARSEVKPDSLLISRMNTPALVGMVSYVSHAPENVFLPDRIWQAQGKHVNLQWLSYMLSSAAISSKIRGLATGTSGSMKNIPKQRLLEMTIPTPPLAEQRVIAGVLSGFDEHLANLDELIVKKKAIRDGALENLLSGEQRIEGFNDDWRVEPLDRIAEINPSSMLPETFTYVDLESVKGTDLISARRVERDAAPSRAQRLAQEGDIFFQTVRPYQRNNYIFRSQARDVAFSTGYAQIRAFGDSEFLFAAIRQDSFVAKVMERCTGTSYPAIAPNGLADISVRIPRSREEQRAIAEVLSGMDEEIRLLVEERAKVERLKLGVMDDLLTGRVRLPVGEEAA